MSNLGSVELKIDDASLKHLQNQLVLLQAHGKRALFDSVAKLAMKIKTEGQLRLKGQGHVKTSRLVNSLYMQANNQQKADKVAGGRNPGSYSAEGKTYDSKMPTVGLTDYEIAVGSNVEYADAMEHGSKPHTIKPKNGKVLAWGQKQSGTVQF